MGVFQAGMVFGGGVGLVAACAGTGGSGGTAGSLAGRTFLSDRVTDGGAARPLVEGTRIRLVFEDGRLSASAGCNTMGGSVEIRADRLVVGDLATTEMGCEPRLHEQDEWLAAFLGSEPRYTLEGDRLDVRATLIDAYEAQHHPMDPPDPIEAIKFRMEQQGLTRRDLEEIIGTRTRIAEVLNRKRGLSIAMIRRLHERLGISAEVLIRPTRKDAA